MSRSRNIWLVVIILLIAFSLWVDLSKNISIANPTNDKCLLISTPISALDWICAADFRLCFKPMCPIVAL